MNINQDENRPKLKKIKRPINRTMPIGEMQNPMHRDISPSAPAPSNNVQNNYQQQAPSSALVRRPQPMAPESKEINEYLDGGQNFSSQQNIDNSTYPNYLSEEEYYDSPAGVSVPEWLNIKIFVASIIVFMTLGLLIGKFLFAQATVVRNGLQGVVVNSEVPRGRARCGIAERSQGCVLYIMNPQRQEMSAKDFYDLAAQMTGRQRFMIETGNMRYGNSRIKPGDIVQLNIPPL